MKSLENFIVTSANNNNFSWQKVYSNSDKIKSFFKGANFDTKKSIRSALRDKELLNKFFTQFENVKLSDVQKTDLKAFCNLLTDNITELNKICDIKVIENLEKSLK